MIKNVVQPFVSSLINDLTPTGEGEAYFGGGFANVMSTNTGPSLSADQTYVIFGILSNTPWGYGYGFADGTVADSTRTAGSNPYNYTLELGGVTYKHPAIIEYNQYGARYAVVEFDYFDQTGNHPTNNWLNYVSINNGAGGGSPTFLGGSLWSRANEFQDQYRSTGAQYKRYGSYGGGMFLLNSVNNEKILTWDLN